MPPPTPEQTMQWLQRGGSIEDIFGIPGGQQTMPFMDEEERDYINDRGITMARGNDLYADPMTRVMLGAAPGGYGPETFESTYTYEPVKAPAYLKLMQMQGSNDAVSKIVAHVMLNGGTGWEAENAVLRSMTDETDQFYQELQNTPALWDNGRPGVAKTPNTSRIQKITDSIDKLALNDPIFGAIGPDGLPANVVDENGNSIQPQDDGSWAREIETKGVGAQEFERLGIASPYDTYDRDLFAQPGVLEEEAAREGRLEEAMNKYILSQQEYDSPETSKAIDKEAEEIANSLRAEAAFERRANEEFSLPLPEYPEATLPESGDAGYTSPLMEQIKSSPYGGIPLGETPNRPEPKQSVFADPMVPETASDQWIGGRRFEVRNDAPQSQYLSQGREQARSNARRQSLMDKTEMYRAQSAAKGSQYDQEKRDAYVRFLARRGYNPYGDQMRGLQQQVYGGF